MADIVYVLRMGLLCLRCVCVLRAGAERLVGCFKDRVIPRSGRARPWLYRGRLVLNAMAAQRSSDIALFEQ